MSDHTENSHGVDHDAIDEDKRDFIHIMTGAVAAVGAGALAWPMVNQMAMASDTKAAGSIEIDLANIEEGEQVKALWRGKPVFVRHRTAAEIEEADGVDLGQLKDPETDNERIRPNLKGEIDPRFLVMVGVCTHFGCVPTSEQNAVDPEGEYGGWYCPCHGSHYDTAGRIRKGPAPANLVIPPYEFVNDTLIKVG